MKKLLFTVNVDWFFLSHRLPIAIAARRRGFEVHVACSVSMHLMDLESFGFIVHPLNIERSSGNVFEIFRSFFRILHSIKNVRPDIVHLVTIKPVLLGGIAARLAGVHSVVAAISGLGYVYVAQGFFAKLRRFLVTVLYKFALGHDNLMIIFQNGDDMINLVNHTGMNEGRIAMIRGSGVDLNLYKPRPISISQSVVILAARLLVDKGVEDFVKAARILRKSKKNSDANVRFVLVGQPDPGNPNSITHKQLNEWVDNGEIEYWGHRSAMNEVLAMASIVTLPSYYGEGLPKVLIEAAACGRAVVTTDHPGCRDAIVPGVSGLLVPIRNPKALANAIQELLDDPERCSAMGRAGREFAEKNFDVNEVVTAHLKIYDKLMVKASQ